MEEDFEAGSSAVQQLTESIQALITANKEAAAAAKERADADKKQQKEEKEANKAKAEATGAFKKVAAAGQDVAREFMSIANAGAKLASTLGTSLTRGTELELKNRLSLVSQLFKVGVDQMATMEQIVAAEKTFVDVIGGAREGMELSTEGATAFANRLKKAAGGEFTLTTAAMQSMITAGIGTAQQFENLRRTTGLRNLNEQRFTQLVNKNSLSFMLYGPRFAKAAQEAEKLGISLASVQSAQESMVTNLDGTLDTVAQINQLGGQIDFGTLTQINETQGPEATLRYLQSTIPPALFQSASTRALLKGLGVSVEDLMKGQQSAQKSAAETIEAQLTETIKDLNGPIETIAGAMATLVAVIEKIKNSFGPLIKAVVLFGVALFALRKIPGLDKLKTMFPVLETVISRLIAAIPFVSGIVGGIAGFTAAKRSGRDNYEASGGAFVRGTLAAAGASLGLAFGGPLGAVIGGLIGNLLGKGINKYFPEVAKAYGEYFRGLFEGFASGLDLLKQSFSTLGKTFREFVTTLFGGEQGLAQVSRIFRDMGTYVGTALVTVLTFAVKSITAVVGVLTALAQVLSFDFKDAFKTFRVTIANFLSGWVPDAITNRIRGDDTISRSGYGDRTLVTPDGSIALNNRDTVVAFADDAIMNGVRTLSLGTIARSMQGASGDYMLTTKVNELISVLQNATTTVNINNMTQQVPRMSLVGVYSRNEVR